MRNKIIIGLLSIIGLGGSTYYFGPKPVFEPINFETAANENGLEKLDSIIAAGESKITDLKPGNEANIVWYDGIKQTEYSVVYLHGFSASHMEGNPVNVDFAKRYGCNIYLPRFAEHGRADTNAFQNLTPENYFESAQQALEIGKKIGKKVILMSCSTGGTFSIMMAEDPAIVAHIMFSPNIDIKDPASTLVTEQWGPQILGMVLGSDYNHIQYSPEAQKYWYAVYHKTGVVTIKRIIKDFMNDENFKKVKQPLFVGYYYKNENENDDVVSVKRINDFYNKASTPQNQKVKVEYPDIPRHVICSSIMTEKTELVNKDIYKFAETVLNLKPVEKAIDQ
jgi:esterase/lipase